MRWRHRKRMGKTELDWTCKLDLSKHRLGIVEHKAWKKKTGLGLVNRGPAKRGLIKRSKI